MSLLEMVDYIMIHRTKTDRTGFSSKFAGPMDNPLCCPIALYTRYVALKPDGDMRFFLHCRKGRLINSPIGINSLSKISSQMAQDRGMPGRFASHSFCASAATAFVENNGTVEQLQQLGDWKSAATCAGYVRGSKLLSRKNEALLVPPTKRAKLPPLPQQIPAQQQTTTPTPEKQVFSGCTFNGCTVVFSGNPPVPPQNEEDEKEK